MNQDESLKCLKLSKERFSQGDHVGALRMGIKAKRMFDSPETTEWLERVKSVTEAAKEAEGPREAAEEAKEDTGTSTVRQRTKVQESSKAAAATSDCLYTPEQVKDVKDFMKRDKNDYYKVLGIEKSAPLDEIKKAYKKLALKFHPDKNQVPGADEAFKIIAVAFSVLGDEEKRRNFDRFGSGGGAGGGFGGFPSSHFSAPGASFSFGADDISPEDIFNMFFQAAFAQQRPGQDGNPFSGGPFGGGAGVQFGGPSQFFFSSNFHNPAAAASRQRRTQRRAAPETTEHEELFKKFAQFIPLIIVFVISLLSSWMFPADPPTANNQRTDHLFSLNPSSNHRFQRSTKLKHVPYFATSNFQRYFEKLKETDASSKLFRELAAYENIIEGNFLKELRQSCDREERQLAQLLKKAAKKEQIEEIKNSFKLNSCDKFRQYS